MASQDELVKKDRGTCTFKKCSYILYLKFFATWLWFDGSEESIGTVYRVIDRWGSILCEFKHNYLWSIILAYYRDSSKKTFHHMPNIIYWFTVFVLFFSKLFLALSNFGLFFFLNLGSWSLLSYRLLYYLLFKSN